MCNRLQYDSDPSKVCVFVGFQYTAYNRSYVHIFDDFPLIMHWSGPVAKLTSGCSLGAIQPNINTDKRI